MQEMEEMFELVNGPDYNVKKIVEQNVMFNLLYDNNVNKYLVYVYPNDNETKNYHIKHFGGYASGRYEILNTERTEENNLKAIELLTDLIPGIIETYKEVEQKLNEQLKEKQLYKNN